MSPGRLPFSALAGKEPASRVRLIDRVRFRARERRYARRTEEAYVHWTRRFVLHHDRRHPEPMGVDEVRSFLSHLAVTEGVAASTQNQALAALVFLYEAVLGRPLPRVEGVMPARRPRKVPVVLASEEVRRIVAALEPRLRLVVMLLYGSGMLRYAQQGDVPWTGTDMFVVCAMSVTLGGVVGVNYHAIFWGERHTQSPPL